MTPIRHAIRHATHWRRGIALVLMAGGIALAARTILSAGDAVVIDDADQEFRQEGGEWKIVGRGHEGQQWAGRYGRGKATAVWTFEEIAAGTYDLYATWDVVDVKALFKNGSLDTRARFNVTNGKRSTTVSLNQNEAPSSDEGTWQRLGRHKIVGGALRVRLQASNVRRIVLADAVMLVPRAAPARVPRFTLPAIPQNTAASPVQDARPAAPVPPAALQPPPGLTSPNAPGSIPAPSATTGGSPAPTVITAPQPTTGPSTSTGASPAPTPSPSPAPGGTATCTDTDGGQEKNTKGTATDALGPHTDYCISENVIAEWTCWAGKAAIIKEACNCVDGVCKGNVLKCTDSDGGDKKEMKGWISDVVYTELWDSCPTPIGQFEYYCVGDRMAATTNSCMCEDGVCKGSAPACLDSDGGMNTGTKGAAYTITGTGPDYCASDLALNEAVCEGNVIKWVKQTCPCKDGACTGTSMETCTDSDGGVNKEVKGKTVDTTYTGSDYCKTMNLLVENSCENGKLTSTEIPCTCTDGVCTGPAGPSCAETDGGIHKEMKGSTTDRFGTATDYCESPYSLFEYNCSSGGSTVGSTHTCACSNGACTGAACTDTDGGINGNAKGTVTSQYGAQTDYCNSSTILAEMSCSGDQPLVTQLTCANCVDGACSSAPIPTSATGATTGN